MKKIIALMLGLVFALSLTACAEQEEARGPEAGTPLNTFYQAVVDGQPDDKDELIFFEESDPNLIGSFYPGLLELELSQQAFYMHPIAATPCQIALVEVTDPADGEKVEEIFKARIEEGGKDTAYPENAVGWTRAQVYRSGSFVGMVVVPEGYWTPENVFEVNEK